MTEKNDNFIALNCYDHIEKRSINIKTKYIVNASGPWTDDVLGIINNNRNSKIGAPAKGVHIVLSGDAPRRIGLN